MNSQPEANSKAPAGRRVLVVDDNIDVAQSLAFLLETDGHEVRIASDGETALQSARTFRPHVVVLDIGLPGMSGHELAKRLRSEPATETAALIALTGYCQQEDPHNTEAAEFDHYLLKPATPGWLLELILATAPAGKPVN